MVNQEKFAEMVGASGARMDQPVPLTEWLKSIDIPKESLVVYKAEEPEVRPRMLKEWAEWFKIEGEIQSKEDVSLISQEKQVLAVYKNTETLWYTDFTKLYHPEYKPELPSGDEAAKVAVDYLKQNDWLPEDAILDGIHRNVFEKVEGDKREKKITRPNNVCVDFRFSLNGLKTYGPGAKIKVFIGDKGEVIGLFRAVRALRKHDTYPALSRKDLEEILRLKLGTSLEGIEIRDIKLVYHAESCVLNTRFVQPVYVFTLAAPAKSKRQEEPIMVNFETHPLPATTFAPIATIKPPSSLVEITKGESLTLSCDVRGGTPPFTFSWDSNVDGHLGDEQVLVTRKLSIAHREKRITSHTVKVTVTDGNGMQDSHQVLVKVHPREGTDLEEKRPLTNDFEDPTVGVEWCNIYHGVAPDISGTDASAQGFKNYIRSLPNWSSRFDWGNDWAWEEDFKFASAPGGGTDYYWADNVHFAFFAGHGSLGCFYFGSAVDDHQMRAQDARWGDGILNWIVLHACETMQANFKWTVWCDAFKGLHLMLGFHTITEGSNPPLGTRFAFWMTSLDIITAWGVACRECFDSSMQYAYIYAGQTGTDTYNDHLPGYGHVSPDPTSPTYWAYSRGTC